MVAAKGDHLLLVVNGACAEQDIAHMTEAGLTPEVVTDRALLALQDAGDTLEGLVWSFAPPARSRPSTLDAVPAATAESLALSRALKARGFVFVGPTTMYAAMQACGLVDDHLAGCDVPVRRPA